MDIRFWFGARAELPEVMSVPHLVPWLGRHRVLSPGSAHRGARGGSAMVPKLRALSVGLRQ